MAKSKPTMNLASFDCAKSDCVEKLALLKALCQKNGSSAGKPEAREFNRYAASSSQEWQKDSVLDVSTRRLVTSGNSEIESKETNWSHNLHKSKDCVPHMEKVLSIVRHRYGLSLRDEI